MILFSRYWLLTLTGFILTIVLFAFPGYSQAPTADRLNQEGFSFLDNGAPSRALSTWREAEQLYRKENDTEGIIGAQLNQSLAEQALGLNSQACKTTARALYIARLVCEPQAESGLISTELAKVEPSSVNTLGIRLLGDNLGLLGNLDEATLALTFARELAQKASLQQSLTTPITFSLANIYNLSFQSALQDYLRIEERAAVERSQRLTQAVENSSKALALYASVGDSSEVVQSTKARLNTIGMLAYIQRQDIGNQPLSQSLMKPITLSAQAAYSALNLNNFDQMTVIDAIYSQLNLANSLLAIKRGNMNSSLEDSITYPDIENLIEAATSSAQQINDNRTLSLAHGTAGDLLSQIGSSDFDTSEQYSVALSLSQSIRAYDISYQWAYKLAKLSEKRGDAANAVKYYESAIASLSSVRNDLLAVSSEVRFSFRERVEPVYRDYMRLLASSEQPKLIAIERVHNSYQLAQIENFLRCGRLVSASELEEDPELVTIHVINLGDFVQVIVSQRGERYGYSMPADSLLTDARRINVNTQADSFALTAEEEIIPYTQRLYDGIIRNAVKAGLIQDKQEIAFVLDAPFQSIPMALLHDGEQYLVQTHPISQSLQMQRVRLGPSGSSALFAGLSKLAPSFSSTSSSSELNPLPETEVEATYLDTYLSASTLLDQDFTADTLGDWLTNRRFKVIHISTHGQFSSIRKETFLLAWNKPIDVDELGRLFKRAEGVDLLFLSACESAAGDSRASLGLAGLAIQSGARYAIAPLWLQDTTAGSLLVQRFYQLLATGESPAKSLQQAQVNLMSSPAYSHPYYWSTFVLAAR